MIVLEEQDPALYAQVQVPGRKIVPERIREDRKPYYAALRAADQAWDQGNLDFSELEDYLARLLAAQLRDKD